MTPPRALSDIPIQECGEALVSLKPQDRLALRPIYHEWGLEGACFELRARQGVAEALTRAAASLPAGYRLIVLDALRPVALQWALWLRFRRELQQQGHEGTELEARLRGFVATPPRTREHLAASPPPHATGGAVDVWLGDDRGEMRDFACAFDEFSLRATEAGFAELLRREATPGLLQARQNRRILREAMTGAGFVAYDQEFWHYELGTRRWARDLDRQAARYGAVAEFVEPPEGFGE